MKVSENKIASFTSDLMYADFSLGLLVVYRSAIEQLLQPATLVVLHRRDQTEAEQDPRGSWEKNQHRIR